MARIDDLAADPRLRELAASIPARPEDKAVRDVVFHCGCHVRTPAAKSWWQKRPGRCREHGAAWAIDRLSE